MKILLSMGGLSESEKKKLNKAQCQVKTRLAIVEKTAAEIISDRRRLYEQNKPLSDMFQMLWNILTEYLEPQKNILSKWGYVKFNILVQMALLGKEFDSNEAVELANADYNCDVATHGPLTREAFFDVMAEIVGTCDWHMQMI